MNMSMDISMMLMEHEVNHLSIVISWIFEMQYSLQNGYFKLRPRRFHTFEIHEHLFMEYVQLISIPVVKL